VITEVLADIGGIHAKHPSYSPDLVPCDLWAVPTLKPEVLNLKFSTVTSVKQTTTVTLHKIPGKSLLHVFEKWMQYYKKKKMHST
jgi:hypothetical protein